MIFHFFAYFILSVYGENEAGSVYHEDFLESHFFRPEIEAH